MKHSLLGYVAFSGSLHALVKLGWVLVVEVLVQRSMGMQAWGSFYSAFSLSMAFYIVLDAGLTTYYTRQLAASAMRKGEGLRGLVMLKAGLWLLHALVVGLAGLLLGLGWGQIVLVLWLGANLAMLSYGQFFRSLFSASGRYGLEAVLANLEKLVLLGLCLYFLVGPGKGYDFNPQSYAALQSLAALVGLGFTVVLVAQNVGFSGGWFPWALLKRVLREGYPYAILSLLMGVYLRLEPIWIERVQELGAADAGRYAASYRITDAFFQFSALFSVILLPLAAKWQYRKAASARLFWAGLALLGGLAWVVFLACGFRGQWLAMLLYGAEGQYLGDLFLLHGFALVPLALSLVSGTLATASGKVKALVWISLGTLLVQIGANVLFQRFWGIEGAAAAFALGQCLHGMATAGLIWRKGGLLLQGRWLVRLLVWMLFSLLVFWGLSLSFVGDLLYLGIAASVSGVTLLALFWPLWVRLRPNG